MQFTCSPNTTHTATFFLYLSKKNNFMSINKTSILTVLSALAICTLLAFSYSTATDDADKAEIEATILKSYIHGAFNELNPEAMAEGFHPDFAIFSAKGEEISKYPIAEWVDGVRSRKSKADFDPMKNKWDHSFSVVDITGGSAIVKVELSKDGTHVFTDYLSLLRFDSGWKIVAKVYHKHTSS